jgi:hypothetical protein
MGAVRVLATGQGDLPSDARLCVLASQLVHGARTGRHPRGGGLGRQSLSYARAWDGVLMLVQMIDSRRGAAPHG